ncbi:MAG TPA: ABC transporter substrate-binding protein [Candidatus Acidoferrales bacterium]|nr:ABC transporter substrate-binding protein [Candidatus Acidoferrales bacterium]
MSRRLVILCCLLIAVLLIAGLAKAQPPAKVRRIGFLGAAFPSSNPARQEALRQGLRELGWIEGKNIAIEYRFAEEKLERLQDLATELVRLKVEVIVTAAPSSTRAAQKATFTTPIVMAGIGGDPVKAGFVASLARPGGNITGLSALNPELSGKQLQLLTEIIPSISRVAVLGTSTLPGYAVGMKETKLAAEPFKIQLQPLDVRGSEHIDVAFNEARKSRSEAVLVLASPVLDAHRIKIASFALKTKLPTMSWAREFVEAGGLMSYGTNIADLYRRAAVYVDKILKGAKPAELPVEQPTKFELVINLKAAKQIGLTIPPNVLARADRVIK